MLLLLQKPRNTFLAVFQLPMRSTQVRGTALIHQASELAAAGRPTGETKFLLIRAEGSFAVGRGLSGGKMTA
jgi:hypothetical protein